MADDNRDLVRTGIAGLDSILGGGIPRGNVIVVEGAVGTGKTTLGLEFIYRGATKFSEPGMVVLFEVSPAKVMRDAANLGWNFEELEHQGLVKILFTTQQVFQTELDQTDSLLIEEAARIGARRIFVDALFSSLRPANHDSATRDPRESFRILAEGLHRENLTAMFAVEASGSETARLARQPAEQFIADTAIVLRIEDVQRAALRSIEVVKSRGHAYQMGRHTFQIVDGRGIEVYRRVQAPREATRDTAASFDPTTRITTGVPGLDELVNGGYFLGSTTLVAGVSGAGKSVMSLHYLAEGARRGERSLMITLDEPPLQILRNANSIGIDLDREVARGMVRLEYFPPQEIEIDRHFHTIEQIIHDFKPTRVVVDSMSAYASTLGPAYRSFRDFIHALVALMKEHQIAAVYNHENPEMLGMSSIGGEFPMSSLVDNILLLNWIELGDVFRLGLTVAKMRANPTRRITHECEIVDGQGMRVLPRELPSGTLQPPFAGHLGLLSRAPERRPRSPA